MQRLHGSQTEQTDAESFQPVFVCCTCETPPGWGSIGQLGYDSVLEDGSSRPLLFFGSSFSNEPRPLHRFLRALRQITYFRAKRSRKFYILTLLRPPPKNGNFAPIFDGTSKISAAKNLNMGMLTCKLPLIVIVAP